MSWKLESGLPDNYDFWVVNAQFGYRDEYMDGQACLLILQGQSPEEGEQEMLLGCGRGWEPVNQGQSIEHPTRAGIVKSSGYGRFIERLIEDEDEGGLGVDMSKFGHWANAETWIGLGFHMQRETFDYGGEVGEVEKPMPTAFLGTKDDIRSDATETAEVDEPSSSPEADEKFMNKLAVLAKKLPIERFQDKALEYDEVMENDALMEDILNESDDGFWARHRE